MTYTIYYLRDDLSEVFTDTLSESASGVPMDDIHKEHIRKTVESEHDVIVLGIEER